VSTPERILVVDDVEDNREIVRARLENQGYAVETANDGEMALAVVAASPPDLILLDVMMPRLDGVETVLSSC
jgi:CheY-like chemotaxis protein